MAIAITVRGKARLYIISSCERSIALTSKENFMGKILYIISMTKVHFYEVIKETAKTALVENIGAAEIYVEDYQNNRIYIPQKAVRKGQIFRVAKRNYGITEYFAGRFGSGSSHLARLWNGQPVGFYDWHKYDKA